MKKIVLLILICIFCNVNKSFGVDGYHFYQQDGRWGVLYNGEPCLLPRFEKVSNIDGGGRFFYKENGKWGVCAADGKEIIPPRYDKFYKNAFDWKYF